MTFAGATSMALLLASASAWGHAVLTSPVPRDLTCDDADCKVGPCGGRSPGAPKYKFEKTGDLKLSWTETIDHEGCFVVELSKTGDDKNFQVLQTIPDDANGVPLTRTSTIRLDGGVECEHCVLRVRQIMSGSSAGCTAATDASTYFSCADIIIGTDAQVPDGGDSDSGGASNPDAGKSGGGKLVDGGGGRGSDSYEVDPLDPSAGKGCGASPQPPGGISYGGLAAGALIFGASATRLLRRRRNRR
ncbi:hypothetical protein [Pendulispora albinea]|uniref:Lytic polysaccharide monooxygenase n=1 Tax=Pendulispora albinea TaxID=2741071 RepID=A0ABZ2LQA7_9BACT